VEAEQFVSNVKCLVSKADKFFVSIIDKTTQEKHPWLAAAVMSREWEYWHKIENQMEDWPDKWDELSRIRKIEGLQWPSFDIEALRSDSKRRIEELLKTMSQKSTLPALIVRPDGFPDYAGQFLHTSGEVAFEALLTNNVDMLKSVFPPYMRSCLIRFNTLRPESGSAEWRAQQDVKIASAALLDVMDVSGYAKLLSDYHGNDALWREVTNVWDEYLNHTRGQLPTPLLVAAISLTDGAWELPHRGILRTTWHQKVNRILTNVPRHKEYHRSHIGSDTEIDHKSALIRVFAREPFGSGNDGIDIFATFYRRNLESANGLDLGWKRRELLDAIERENQKTISRNAEQDEQ
jgi:hypothetical protein